MRSFFFCFAVSVCHFLSILPPAEPDLASDRAALLALRSAVGGRSLLWNLSDSSPCSWPGVQCSSGRDFVAELHLPGMGLSGAIPPGTIGNLTRLRTLSLRYNALSGHLPSGLFSSLRDLRKLYLQHNFFSGDIPADIFSLPNLVRLNLAHNNFSGSIPPSINKLTRLSTLYLEENHFSGEIPDLNILGLAQINVSSNQLTGQIPAKLSARPKTAFQGNSLCGKPLDACKGQPEKSKTKLSGGAIAGIVIGAVFGLILILLLLLCLCRKRGEREVRSTDAVGIKQTEIEIPPGEKETASGGVAAAKEIEEASKPPAKGRGGAKNLVFFERTGGEGREYDMDDLLKASAEVLGKGTFGTAYKAVLEAGITLVVKRLREVTVPEKEFREKIEGVGKMNHPNLVPLRAYHYSQDEKLLVYDYVPMGSLSALLHGNRGGGRTPLNWETRTSIALGAAKGISYLHSQGHSISHGNIKSSNILLTKSYEPRVSDFGLAQLVGPSASPTRVDGYRAPEVTDPRRASHAADVYGFGVLLLELLTGKSPATHSSTGDEGVDLPRWVQSVVREEWTSEVFDVQLLRYMNGSNEEDMVQLLQLAVNCTAQYPDKRPLMTEVTARIEDLVSGSSSKDHTTDDNEDQIHNDM
ncbi:unnamed protein product [Cuscuta campestris]|uniref:Protein kinase domain-containing protein n=1 Tax=Cuscuta campestris TaxID=132261 RepID=A0A484NHA6_9ASTE|nr:unnamed protein product [Cuscuta campestris]